MFQDIKKNKFKSLIIVSLFILMITIIIYYISYKVSYKIYKNKEE